MARSRSKQYGICVCNQGHAVSLDLWKVYRLLPDIVAEHESMVRVIDNEDEDYLYPASWFVTIDLPAGVERRIKAAGQRTRRISKPVETLKS